MSRKKKVIKLTDKQYEDFVTALIEERSPQILDE